MWLDRGSLDTVWEDITLRTKTIIIFATFIVACAPHDDQLLYYVHNIMQIISNVTKGFKHKLDTNLLFRKIGLTKDVGTLTPYIKSSGLEQLLF